MIKKLLLIPLFMLLVGCVPGVNMFLYNNSGSDVAVCWCKSCVNVAMMEGKRFETCNGEVKIISGEGGAVYEYFEPTDIGYSLIEPYIEYPSFFGRGVVSFQLNQSGKVYLLERGDSSVQKDLPEQPLGFPREPDGFEGNVNR